ncbi:MAG: hypothetical protein ABL996_22090 [Micropepsaceae bacterium]
MVFDVIFVLVQATTVALCAAFATAIVLDAWPTPAGILGVFLLYVVLGSALRFSASLPEGATLWGREEYVSVFFAVLVLGVVLSQTEFLRPENSPRMSFNQASTIFFVCGLALTVVNNLGSAIENRDPRAWDRSTG